MTAALTESMAVALGIKSAEQTSQPSTNLDAALDWAEQGFHVFPCKPMLGTPLVDWYGAATTDKTKIVSWWTAWPHADIGAKPESSGHFALCAFADEGGLDALSAFEEEHGELPVDLFYLDVWGNLTFWISGSAYTSHNKLGPGLHVLGRGHRVFLPPSVALHTVYR